MKSKYHGNYQYSLSGQDQSNIQIWLRLLPHQYRTQEWELLHSLTYAESWTDEPKFELKTTQETKQ